MEHKPEYRPFKDLPYLKNIKGKLEEIKELLDIMVDNYEGIKNNLEEKLEELKEQEKNG